MIQKFIIDTNIIIRVLTKDVAELAQHAEKLLKQAEDGKISFFIPSMVVAEACWALQSFYPFSKKDIGQALQEFLQSESVELEEPWIFDVLHHYMLHNVDFIDAYLAQKANRRSLGVITWNQKHFKRLPCDFYTPENLIND